jgi:alpha-amylase/alpha-mannosidase (GH57 family)
MPRHIAMHLHLYQPPREVPSLGTVAREVSAAPFHDWNERITAECYRPLTAARLLDERGLIAAAPNLFEQISFNVGPTLHAWLEEHAPDVDDAIRAADAATVRRDGHGHAMAQPYAHAILPLATPRDRETLVRWGVTDFRRRFGRDPEGMWLPETAVDVATLESLAAAGIGFTIVGQHQIARTRAPGGVAWRPAVAGVDPFVPYAVRLPSGRSITVCAFDSQLSRAAAFDHELLGDGARFADRLRGALPDDAHGRLVTVATDGETFGHHHRFGEMALGRALQILAADAAVGVGGIGAFIAAHPPEYEAELFVPSAWSCGHGVERWRSDCGDSTGGGQGWNQSWRAPLRQTLDWLRDRLAAVFETEAGRLLRDPWEARDDYAEVFAVGADARIAFVQKRAAAPIAQASRRSRSCVRPATRSSSPPAPVASSSSRSSCTAWRRCARTTTRRATAGPSGSGTSGLPWSVPTGSPRGGSAMRPRPHHPSASVTTNSTASSPSRGRTALRSRLATSRCATCGRSTSPAGRGPRSQVPTGGSYAVSSPRATTTPPARPAVVACSPRCTPVAPRVAATPSASATALRASGSRASRSKCVR